MKERLARIHTTTRAAIALVGVVATAGGLFAADFLRGDANGDGVVSLSDALLIERFLFKEGLAPQCESAADFNDDGFVNIYDAVEVVYYPFAFMRGDLVPPAPFPNVGPDLEPDSLRCDSYGGGTPFDDPTALLRIRDATAVGGNSRAVVLTLEAASAYRIGAFNFRLRFGTTLATQFVGRRRLQFPGVADPSNVSFVATNAVKQVNAGELEVGVFYSVVDKLPLGFDSRTPSPLLQISVCLEPGTPAGAYPVSIESAEFALDCDAGTGHPNCVDIGRAIYPRLEGATLVVESSISGGAECPAGFPPPPAPIAIQFKLKDASGPPGGNVAVPFSVKADRASAGFSYSINFDETLLEATGTERLWQTPDGTPYEFEKFEWNNADASDGDSGVDEGYFAGAAVISFTDSGNVIPPNADTEVLLLRIRIKPSAPLGQTRLTFTDGAQPSESTVRNMLIAGGVDLTPETSSGFVFVNASINILAGVTTFIRGDANGDLELHISDPIFTLGYLYLGEGDLKCGDAADATDDGSIDIADPILTLTYLFQGGARIPEPFASAGFDPTGDALTCGGLPD